MRNKKEIQGSFSVKFKETTDKRVLKFVASQSNLTDTILYLIQKEISQNGIRDLQTIIPPIRDIDNFFEETTQGKIIYPQKSENVYIPNNREAEKIYKSKIANNTEVIPNQIEINSIQQIPLEYDD